MQRQSCAQTLNEIHVVAVRQVGIDQCQTKRMVLNHLLGAGDSSGAANVVVGNAERCQNSRQARLRRQIILNEHDRNQFDGDDRLPRRHVGHSAAAHQPTVTALFSRLDYQRLFIGAVFNRRPGAGRGPVSFGRSNAHANFAKSLGSCVRRNDEGGDWPQ